MQRGRLLTKFLIWRIRHVSTKNFILVLGGIIGIIGGVAAVTLKSAVHYLQETLFDLRTSFTEYIYLIFPFVGIALTVFVARKIFKDRMGQGVTAILYAISKKSSIISQGKMYTRMITSCITVGFGGSVGLEAPIIVTGSAIGSNIGQLMHLNYKQRTLLIGCGAAAAISGIFNSPVAGVIFAVEVVLTDVTIAVFIPLLLASVMGSLVSMLFLGDAVLFSFNLQDSFTASDFPFYLLLGAICGLVSVYFSRMTSLSEQWVSRIQSQFWRVIVGGLALGIIVFFFHPIYGEGYNSITDILNGRQDALLVNSILLSEFEGKTALLLFTLGIILFKPFATGATIGTGGSGGVSAPSLFMGGFTGFLFAELVNLLNLGKTLSVSNFTLVGMCGVMSGVLHAPLTAIFLIAEITSGYTLFLPLMLVSAIALSTNSYFQKYSFYTGKLIRRGDLIPYDKDRQVLSLIKIDKLIEKDLLTIHPEESLGDLVTLVRRSKRNIFPVIDDEGALLGIVTLDDIREIMFDEVSQKNVIVASLMHKPPDTVTSGSPMQEVMHKFERTGAWNLPVIDDGKYLGIVSKSRIFNAYRLRLRRNHKE